MITLLILIFTALHSPLTWNTALLLFFCFGVGFVMSGFVGYTFLRDQLPATSLDSHLALFLSLAIVSGLFSTWFEGSVIRILTMTAYIIAYYFIYSGISEETLVNNIVRAGWILIITCGVCSLGGWWYYLGNRNVLASILLLTLPFGTKIRERSWRWFWFIMGGTVIISTKSVGGIIGMAIALIILWNLNKQLIFPIGLSLLPFIVVFKRYSVTIRFLCIWPTAIRAFVSSPLIGIGPAAVGQWLAPQCEPMVPHAHNIFLTILAEMGIVGLTAFCLLLWQIWQHHRPGPAWAALCGFMIYSLVDDPIWFWAPGLGVMSLLAIMVRGSQNDNK